MRISQLDGLRVALWGWGREGRAAYRAVRGRLPDLSLTLFCTPGEVEDARSLSDACLDIRTDVDGAALSGFEVVIKSPGISPYGPAAREASDAGTRFIGGTALWFAEHAGADALVPGSVCVTGTKGKSTTTSLLAHLLRAGGTRAALAGNIGLPLLELLDPDPRPQAWAIELSSYQTGDVAASGARPDVAVVLNIFPEHLDWHGSHARYVEDKLRLVSGARPRVAVLNAADPILRELALPGTDIRWFGDASGWHLREDTLYRADEAVLDTRGLPLPGRHNRGNLAAVLTALDAMGHDARALARHAATFRPLPHRLQWLGERNGVGYVNDSISTTPHATLAALECFSDRPVAVLVGGHDRGLDWQAFVDALRVRAPVAVVTMGANGPRIHSELERLDRAAEWLHASDSLDNAMATGRQALAAAGSGSGSNAGVVLLSPGAPSFGPYRDYVHRGREFARLAGFDPDSIDSIPGLGIA